MSLIPAFEIGLWNAWLGMLILLIASNIPIILHLQEYVSLRRPGFCYCFSFYIIGCTILRLRVKNASALRSMEVPIVNT